MAAREHSAAPVGSKPVVLSQTTGQQSNRPPPWSRDAVRSGREPRLATALRRLSFFDPIVAERRFGNGTDDGYRCCGSARSSALVDSARYPRTASSSRVGLTCPARRSLQPLPTEPVDHATGDGQTTAGIVERVRLFFPFRASVVRSRPRSWPFLDASDWP
jgi:hypothetical protein